MGIKIFNRNYFQMPCISCWSHCILSQTPAELGNTIVILWDIHEHRSIPLPRSTLLGLGVAIDPHLICRLVPDFNIPTCHIIGYQEILNLMCLVRLELEAGPLISNLMLAWLSWYKILCSTVNPKSSIKYLLHSVPRLYLSRKNSWYLFSAWRTYYLSPPYRTSWRPLQSQCVLSEASTSQCTVPKLSTSSVSFMCFVSFR